MPTSPVSPQIALARSLSEQERRRRQAAEAQVRPRINDPILRKFLRVLFRLLWLTTQRHQTQAPQSRTRPPWRCFFLFLM